MTAIANEVMKKVRKVFLVRKLVAPFAFLVAASAVIASTVSVSHVIANMPSFVDVPAVAQFIAAAFAHADVVVKSALVAGSLFLLMTLKGVVDSRRIASFQRV
jgi:hypothetical protein